MGCAPPRPRSFPSSLGFRFRTPFPLPSAYFDSELFGRAHSPISTPSRGVTMPPALLHPAFPWHPLFLPPFASAVCICETLALKTCVATGKVQTERRGAERGRWRGERLAATGNRVPFCFIGAGFDLFFTFTSPSEANPGQGFVSGSAFCTARSRIFWRVGLFGQNCAVPGPTLTRRRRRGTRKQNETESTCHLDAHV